MRREISAGGGVFAASLPPRCRTSPRQVIGREFIPANPPIVHRALSRCPRFVAVPEALRPVRFLPSTPTL
ncbi:hypothetical protein CU254_17050 [Amycolatopsis sp. AA4]|nr:hypothetical protein CU254_17050 [Amycolatopsis sp. AA4]EFL07680.1 predicted protein [Streptomyces sp. AA4]